MESTKKIKPKLSLQQAHLKAEKYCAYQERCQQEMRDKLYDWGLHSNQVENIISELITTNFINEERFAKAYAGGKFRIKKWGRVKIRIELKKRKISDYCIKKALLEINDTDYYSTLQALIEKKSKEVKDKNLLIKNHKIAKYVASKGFESDLIWGLIKEQYTSFHSGTS